MAKKIEGCTPDGHYITNGGVGDFCPLTHMPGSGYYVGRQEQHRQATLVIHDGPHEPVYTASEVRAMLKEIVDAREAVRNSPEGMVWATPRQDIEVIASKHGINIADADVMGLHVPKADHAS